MRKFWKSCAVVAATVALIGTTVQAPAAMSWYSRVVDRVAPNEAPVRPASLDVIQTADLADPVAVQKAAVNPVTNAQVPVADATEPDAAEADAATTAAAPTDAPAPTGTFASSAIDMMTAAPVTEPDASALKADRSRDAGKSHKSKKRVAPAEPAPAAPAPTEPPADPAEPPADPVDPPAPPAQTGRWFGFYVPGSPANGLDSLSSLEGQLGNDADVVNFFISDSESFPESRCQVIADHDAIPLVTLEFWSTQDGGLASIANGDKDAYLYAFAEDARDYGGEVWLRPFHEMNGNWYPWAGTEGSNDAGDLIAAWRRVENIFDARGADNVKFVWCVNNDSVPNTSANSWTRYYPGDNYVDYVSIDGYNWGTTSSWSSWRSFSSCFGAPYDAITAITDKPMLIGETSCVEEGGSKAAWIADMFAKIESRYTRIEGVCWFNANKERDWRAESSTSSLNAYKSAMVAGY